ncbi:MAG: cell division protein ZapA [Deltaproteobacteria bacterium]|nr:cell division protein ZapA [Candidatus Tharpella sp.]
MATEKISVTITVRGKKYPFRTEADSQRVQQVVDFVDKKLEELDTQGGVRPKVGFTDIRLVVLALLNIADECLTHQQYLGEIKERSEKLMAEIAFYEDL